MEKYAEPLGHDFLHDSLFQCFYTFLSFLSFSMFFQQPIRNLPSSIFVLLSQSNLLLAGPFGGPGPIWRAEAAPLCASLLLFVSKHVSSTPSNRPPLIAGRLSGRIQKNKRSPDNHKPGTFKRDLKTLCLDLSRQGGGVGPQSSLEGGVRNVGG